MGPSSGFALNEPAFCVILNGTTWAELRYSIPFYQLQRKILFTQQTHVFSTHTVAATRQDRVQTFYTREFFKGLYTSFP